MYLYNAPRAVIGFADAHPPSLPTAPTFGLLIPLTPPPHKLLALLRAKQAIAAASKANASAKQQQQQRPRTSGESSGSPAAAPGAAAASHRSAERKPTVKVRRTSWCAPRFTASNSTFHPIESWFPACFEQRSQQHGALIISILFLNIVLNPHGKKCIAHTFWETRDTQPGKVFLPCLRLLFCAHVHHRTASHGVACRALQTINSVLPIPFRSSGRKLAAAHHRCGTSSDCCSSCLNDTSQNDNLVGSASPLLCLAHESIETP